jgi:hypothetical protein
VCHLDHQCDYITELILLGNKIFKNKEGEVEGTYQVRDDIWRSGGIAPFSHNLQHWMEVNGKQYPMGK